MLGATGANGQQLTRALERGFAVACGDLPSEAELLRRIRTFCIVAPAYAVCQPHAPILGLRMPDNAKVFATLTTSLPPRW